MTSPFVAPDRDGLCTAELWIPDRPGYARGTFVECGRPDGHDGDHLAGAPIGRLMRKGEPGRYRWSDGDPDDEGVDW